MIISFLFKTRFEAISIPARRFRQSDRRIRGRISARAADPPAASRIYHSGTAARRRAFLLRIPDKISPD